MSGRRLVLIELNEINFDIVSRYIEGGLLRLPALKALLAGPKVVTSSERRYEELEPWIQWPSVHSGMSFPEHGIFRLGDVVNAPHVPQMFEQLEAAGYRIGVISAMNAANRLRSPAYFIPDPWTKTDSDGSAWSRGLAAAVSQAVNDNSAGRITLASAAWLVLGLIRFSRIKNYGMYLSLAARALKASWRRALFLDLFLNDLHVSLMKARRPDFSAVFLNAGAHIQHHYFHNAVPLKQGSPLRNPGWYVADGVDPIGEMLVVYDRIVGDYLKIEGVDLIVATGLSQKPYDRVKFYYRLKDHAGFLRQLGIKFSAVFPRMTRDFLVEFSDAESAREAEGRLRAARVATDGESLFGEIDNRGNSLFVTLTYPNEIDSNTRFECGDIEGPLGPHTVFVAIKNGMHQERGFAFFRGGVSSHSPEDGAHVKELYSTIMSYFGLKSAG